MRFRVADKNRLIELKHILFSNIAQQAGYFQKPNKFKGLYLEKLRQIVIQNINSPDVKWSAYIKNRYNF